MKVISARPNDTLEIIILIFTVIAVMVFLIGHPAHSFTDKGELSKITLPQDLDEKEVALTVTGKIGITPPARFDLITLERFPKTSFVTYDPWDFEEVEYEGLLLSDLIHFLEIESSATLIEIHARNDYKATIGVKDIDSIGYLLAYKMNGKYFHDHEGKRNKGPLCVAIDFNTNKEIDMDVYKQNLVWWIDIIKIK